MERLNRPRTIFLLVVLLLPLVQGGDVYLSPQGVDNWDGNCGTSPVCSEVQPCLLKAMGAQDIISIDGSSCTVHFATGSYGSNKPTIHVTASGDAEVVLTSSGASISALLYIDANSHPLAISELRLSSYDSSFTSTNETAFTIDQSFFELTEGPDPEVAIFAFNRDTSLYYPTIISHTNFTTASSNVYQLGRFNTQNLHISNAFFTGPESAILGTCETFSCLNCVFNTPSIYQGDVIAVTLEMVTAAQISDSAFRGSSSLTNVTLKDSRLVGQGNLGRFDQLTEDPSILSFEMVNVQGSSFGDHFSLGSLPFGVNASLLIEDSSFSESAGTFTLVNASSVNVRGNVFGRTVDMSSLSLIVAASDLSPASVVLSSNEFAQSPSSSSFITANLVLSNVNTLIGAETQVLVNSLAIGGQVLLAGQWTVLQSIVAIEGAPMDSAIHTDSTSVIQIDSIEIQGISLDLRAASLVTYAPSHPLVGIVGPDTSQGHFLKLSAPPALVWLSSELPIVNFIYPFSSSLETLPSDTFTIGARFNYTLIAGTGNIANMTFNPVSCPSSCNPDHASTVCVAMDACTCLGAFGGVFCNCNKTGMPVGWDCLGSGQTWSAPATSITLLTPLILPLDHNMNTTHPLTLNAAFTINGGLLTAQAPLTFNGPLSLTSSLIRLPTTPCLILSQSRIMVEGAPLTLGPGVSVRLELDLGSLEIHSDSDNCEIVQSPNFALIGTTETLTIQNGGQWQLQFANSSSSGKRSSLSTSESAQSNQAFADSAILNSSFILAQGEGGIQGAPQIASTSSISSTTCFTTRSASTLITMSMGPCPPSAPTPPTEETPDTGSKNKPILWWYWGIPVIVVGAVLILLLLILLIKAPCKKKTASYRGSI